MTDPTTAAPLVAVLQPYLLSLEAVVVPMLVAWGVRQVSRWTGEKIAQSDQDKISAAVTNEVGKIILAADRSIATAKTGDVTDRVLASAEKIINAPGLQTAIKRLGITPNLVASLVEGALGQAQKSMVPAVVVSPPGPMQPQSIVSR